MLNNPLFQKFANTVIVDGRISVEMKSKLKNEYQYYSYNSLQGGLRTYFLPSDITIHPINHNTLIVAPNVFDYYEDKLRGMGIKIIKVKLN